MKVFLAGGTGFVGGQVRKALLARGHQVVLLVHRRGSGQQPGVHEVLGDAVQPDSFAGQLAGCDAVINLIGIIREFPGRGITFERLHVEATRNMVSAARSAGVRRYLQMSALGTREGASTGYFRTKFQAEQEVRGSGLDFTIFRPSVVFGPEDDFVNTLAGMLRTLPVVPVIGDGKYQLQPISVSDVARCFVESLEKPGTVGKTYELCGPDRLSYNELLDAIARALGKSRAVKLPNPLGLMRLVVPVLQQLPFFPITTDQLEMLVQGNTCDGSWRSDFGFQPLGFEEGIRSYLKR